MLKINKYSLSCINKKPARYVACWSLINFNTILKAHCATAISQKHLEFLIKYYEEYSLKEPGLYTDVYNLIDRASFINSMFNMTYDYCIYLKIKNKKIHMRCIADRSYNHIEKKLKKILTKEFRLRKIKRVTPIEQGEFKLGFFNRNLS